jgi:hypothetical protein
MKKIIISSVFMSIFFSLFLFHFYVAPLNFAVIPKWAVPFSAISSFLKNSPKFLIIAIYILGLSIFSYTIYQLVGIIQERMKNWFKTGYFAFVIAVVFLYGFIFSENFYFFPLIRFKILPINHIILGCLVFSTILLFTLKDWKKYIITYIIFSISYFLILETYGNALLVNRNFTLFFAPMYVILLYLLVYNFIKNENLYPYLAIFLVFIPVKIKQKNKYKPFYTDKTTVTYTMIAPSEDYYKVENFERPFTSWFTYLSILELDSTIYYAREELNSYAYLFAIDRYKLNNERIKLAKEPLNNEKLYVGKRYREKIGEIMNRWESGKEKGIISGKIKGEIPDRVGLLKHTRMDFTWPGNSLQNLVDAVSTDPNGVFTFRYIPPGKYELLLFYKKRVPNYKVKIPIIESNNDTVNLGKIEIR